MKLFTNTTAKFALNARKLDGTRLDVNEIEGAEYTLSDGIALIKKDLTNGLAIEYSDNLGYGVLVVTLTPADLNFTGRARQQLIYSCCDGNNYAAILRPEFINVVSRN